MSSIEISKIYIEVENRRNTFTEPRSAIMLKNIQCIYGHNTYSISFEVMLPSACSFIVDGSLSYV
jgi:hypothetical protein